MASRLCEPGRTNAKHKLTIFFVKVVIAVVWEYLGKTLTTPAGPITLREWLEKDVRLKDENIASEERQADDCPAPEREADLAGRTGNASLRVSILQRFRITDSNLDNNGPCP
jgi:hypothetical protein